MNLNGQLDDLQHVDTFDDNEPDLTPVNVTHVDSFGDDDDTKSGKSKDVKPVDNPFEPKDNDKTQITLKNEIIEDLLKTIGIVDQSKVLYEDETGNTVELDFYDLPREDQISILSNSNAQPELSEEDLYYIQQAKENDISLTELIKFYQNKSIEEYTQSQQQDYTVANYSDEQLYALDMKSKFGDAITEDEIMAALSKELELPEIFKKKVDKLREDYIQIEEAERASIAQSIEDQKTANFNEFQTTISTFVESVEDVGGIVLEDDDKNDILSFMLQKDVNGVTGFQKQMNDPENIFLAAWAILKAEDSFDILKSHYEGLLKNSKKNTQQVQKDKGTQVSTVVKPQEQRYQRIEDLHKFDE